MQLVAGRYLRLRFVREGPRDIGIRAKPRLPKVLVGHSDRASQANAVGVAARLGAVGAAEAAGPVSAPITATAA